MNRSICTTCDLNLTCSFKDNCCIWDCSEFRTSTIGDIMNIKIHDSIPKSFSTELCTTCNLKSTCTWRDKHIKIHYCEHYE